MILSNTTCVCWSNYVLINGVCTSLCGDGIVIKGTDQDVDCDDGNLIDGDGCTAQCKVEEAYGCRITNSLNLTSLCALLKVTELQYLYTHRIQEENTAELFLEVISTDVE